MLHASPRNHFDQVDRGALQANGNPAGDAAFGFPTEHAHLAFGDVIARGLRDLQIGHQSPRLGDTLGVDTPAKAKDIQALQKWGVSTVCSSSRTACVL
jgi:hypothetical protein